MKYSNLLDTKIMTERSGPQMPRLVQYANDEEIKTKRNFLDWDILNAKSTIILNDFVQTQISQLQHTVYPLSINFNGGGIYEYGTQPSVTLTWSVTRNGVSITPTIQKINDTDVTSPTVYNPTSDTTYVLYVEYDNQTASSSEYVKFVYPSYCGIVEYDFVPDSTNILLLGKTIKDNKNFNITYTELNNQKVCYAYPKQYGDLSSIKDINGFEYINSYILSTITIDTIDYNVYLLENPTSIINLKQIYS